ncbi:MAG: hypothetical protein WCI18_13900 [Pseudomonadota bacterium]
MKKIHLQFGIVLILSVFSFSACEDGKMSGAAKKATPSKNGLANGGADGSGTGGSNASDNATGAPGSSDTADGSGDNKGGSTGGNDPANGNSATPGSGTASAPGSGANGSPTICVGGKKVSLDGMGMIVNSKNASGLATGSSLGQCNTSCHMQYPGHHGGSFNGRCEDADCHIPGTNDDSQCKRCVYDEAC